MGEVGVVDRLLQQRHVVVKQADGRVGLGQVAFTLVARPVVGEGQREAGEVEPSVDRKEDRVSRRGVIFPRDMCGYGWLREPRYTKSYTV